MKPVWKWALGIFAVLVVLCLLSLPFVMMGFNSFGGYGMMSGPRSGWRMPMHPGFGSRMPMMGGGFVWMGLGMLFSGLIQLGVLVLLVLGIVWLVRAIARQGKKDS